MIACPKCGTLNDRAVASCDNCGHARTKPLTVRRSFITMAPNGSISVMATSKDEHRLALGELKQKKKECALLKRQISEQIRLLKTEYAQEVRMRNSKFRGGGTIGRLIRGFQTVERDSRRQELGAELEPLEQQQADAIAMELAIDKMILQIQMHLDINS